jgi:hypothetical protein
MLAFLCGFNTFYGMWSHQKVHEALASAKCEKEVQKFPSSSLLPAPSLRPHRNPRPKSLYMQPNAPNSNSTSKPTKASAAPSSPANTAPNAIIWISYLLLRDDILNCSTFGADASLLKFQEKVIGCSGVLDKNPSNWQPQW